MNAFLNPTPIHAANPGPITGDGNWTWLIHGRVPTLIDAGTGDPRHLSALDAALAGASLHQVLVTHAHTDHASGAPALAERFTHASFSKFPWSEGDRQWAVDWQPLADGDVVEAGDTTLVAVFTPGHSPDHLCFWHEESRTVFGGDLAIKDTTVWIPARLQGDLGAYLRSLERVIALAPARLLPAHGEIIHEPVALLNRYIAHRLEREAQVLAALRVGDATADGIVARLYRGLHASVVPLAKESVIAHLQKLEREGRVKKEEEIYQLTN